MPPVFTWTSWRISNTASWREWPLIRLVVEMPSMVKLFSAPLAPLTWKPPSISPEFTDVAVSASDWKLRAFGSRSNSSAVMLFAIGRVRGVDQNRGLRDGHRLLRPGYRQLSIHLECLTEEQIDVGNLTDLEALQLQTVLYSGRARGSAPHSQPAAPVASRTNGLSRCS